MKCYIVDTLCGIFALNETGNILNFLDFDDNNEKIIEFYNSLEIDLILDEYKDFLIELRNSGSDEFIFDNKKLELLTIEKLNLKSELDISSLEFKNFRLNLENQLKKVGINKNRNEIIAKYKEINQALIKNKVSQVGAQNDVVISQIIETSDIIKKSISLFIGRLREWYGLHFPELTDKVIEDNSILTKLILVLGHRDNFTIENIKKNFDLKEERVKYLFKQASESMGSELEIKIIQNYANQILSLNSYTDELENYLEDLMEKTAPNLKSLVGALIGAKLIAKAGGLRKLAFMPASRIQILGAEKALYKFLKTGEKRPKHGLIFQWNKIRGSPPWIRGKIARAIAGKVGLASKIDFFSGDFIGDLLSKEIEEKIKKIEVNHPNPPVSKSFNKPTRSNKNQKRGKKRR